MKKLLESIVSALIRNSDCLKVVELESDASTIYQIHVNKEDLGRLIGKRGKNILAIKTIISAAESNTGTDHSLIEIIED